MSGISPDLLAIVGEGGGFHAQSGVAVEPGEGRKRYAEIDKIVLCQLRAIARMQGSRDVDLAAQFRDPAINPAMVAEVFHPSNAQGKDERL